jgi:S-adenosyl methyltransferase
MDSPDSSSKPATAARMYDYYLGGMHNFPADQEAARRIISQLPTMPLVARENRAVTELIDALAPGSYVAISAAAAESFGKMSESTRSAIDVYKQRTTTGAAPRTKEQFTVFFAGLEPVEPGVVWLHRWPGPTVVHPEFVDDPARSGEWAGVARKR